MLHVNKGYDETDAEVKITEESSNHKAHLAKCPAEKDQCLDVYPDPAEFLNETNILQHSDGECRNIEQQLVAKKGELALMFLQLMDEREKRRRLEEGLQIKEIELKRMSSDLAEVHTTLKILLDRTNIEQAEFANRLISNIKHCVFPYLLKLRDGNLDDKAREYLVMIESHLCEIVSPFSSSISTLNRGLTPAEIQIADLIREGKTTKEISIVLNLSGKSIEFHRNNHSCPK
jgi:hypothetical protein